MRQRPDDGDTMTKKPGRPVTNRIVNTIPATGEEIAGRDLRGGGWEDQAVFGTGPATLDPAVRRFHGISFPSRPRASIVI